MLCFVHLINQLVCRTVQRFFQRKQPSNHSCLPRIRLSRSLKTELFLYRIKRIPQNITGKMGGQTDFFPESPDRFLPNISRFPNDLIDAVEEAIRGKDCTFSAFVVEAVRVALETLREEAEEKN